MKTLCLIWDIWNSISELCLWLFADKPVGACVSSDKTHDEHMKVTAGIVRKITLIAEGFSVHKGRLQGAPIVVGSGWSKDMPISRAIVASVF